MLKKFPICRCYCFYISSKNSVQVRILRSLKHPNVIDIYQFFKDDSDRYYVSIEYMRGGELFDRIVKKVGYIKSGVGVLFAAVVHACGVCFVSLRVFFACVPYGT